MGLSSINSESLVRVTRAELCYPIAIATRPQGVNIISKVVNPPNGCYAQYIHTLPPSLYTLGFTYYSPICLCISSQAMHTLVRLAHTLLFHRCLTTDHPLN